MTKEKPTTVKVGFFGGSFDPIHFGHLKMARELAAAHQLEQVWFCPAHISPHKQDRIPVSTEDRMNMVQLAIENDSNFILLDIEAKREGPSFTVDTIKELVKSEELSPSPRKIYLILSDETMSGFFQWKQPEEIVKMVPLLIGSRYRDPLPKLGEGVSLMVYEAIKKGWSPTQPINISSTEIRQRLHRGLDCQDYVPKKVLDYISQNKLYS